MLSAEGLAAFRKPRGLRFGRDGNLYCVAQDEVVAFDFLSGRCLGAVVQLSRLHGQALIFFPDLAMHAGGISPDVVVCRSLRYRYRNFVNIFLGTSRLRDLARQFPRRERHDFMHFPGDARLIARIRAIHSLDSALRASTLRFGDAW